MKPQMANWRGMTKLSRLMAVVTFVSCAGMLACSDDNNSGSSADIAADPDTVRFYLARSIDTPDFSRGPVLDPMEEILYQLNFTKQVIEPGAGTTLFFPDSEELHGDEGHRLKTGSEADDVWRTVEDVQGFLEAHWDEYWEGVEDPGWNSQELIDYLLASDLSHDLLLEHFFESGAQDLTEFLTFVNYAADQTGLSVSDVFEFFETAHVPYSGIIYSLADAGATEDQLWAAMEQAGYDFDDLANLYVRDHPTDFSAAVADLVYGPSIVAMADPPGPAYAKVALEAAKLVYQVIKDGAPTAELDLSSNIKVLNPLDDDWTNYYSPKDVVGKQYHWYIEYLRILGPTINSLDVYWQTKATFSDSHVTIPGYYIPNLYPVFQVPNLDWGQTLNVNFKIAQPSNRASGPYHPTVACLPYIVSFSNKTIFQAWSATWDAKANAKIGKEEGLIDLVDCDSQQVAEAW
jgi:hypothetical protein